MKQQAKKQVLKSVLSAVSLGLLLSLTACSDNTAVEETVVVSDPDLVVAEEQVAEANPEVVQAEPIAVDESTTSTAVAPTDTEVSEAEPELLTANAGAELYEAQCKMCHDTGLLNAPRYGDKAAWSAALAKDKQTLYMHSAQGFNQMPAQAVNGVSEAQVIAAVDYLLASVE